MSAEKGYAPAQYMMGNISRGNSNYEAAQKWWTKAAENGSMDAQEMLGSHYSRLENFDFDKAIYWYTKATEQGSSGAPHAMARLYSGEMEIDEREKYKDYGKAVKWYTLSAERGFEHAQIRLGEIYDKGELGTKQDRNKAEEWYIKAAEQDNSEAQFKLARFYYNDNGTTHDYDKAFQWLIRATAQRTQYKAFYSYNAALYYAAFSLLGDCYSDGKGVVQDYKKAIEMWKKAGTPYAQNEIGNCYRDGKGVVQNADEAAKWYTLSSNGGNKEAKIALKEQIENTALWNGFTAAMTEAQVTARLKSLYKLNGGITKTPLVRTGILDNFMYDFPTESGLRGSPLPTPDFRLSCEVQDSVFKHDYGDNLSFYFYKKGLYCVAVSWATDIRDDGKSKDQRKLRQQLPSETCKAHPRGFNL